MLSVNGLVISCIILIVSIVMLAEAGVSKFNKRKKNFLIYIAIIILLLSSLYITVYMVTSLFTETWVRVIACIFIWATIAFLAIIVSDLIMVCGYKVYEREEENK